ncbi:hypothetical protein ACVXG7_11870 [Enterobacter hormaechei]
MKPTYGNLSVAMILTHVSLSRTPFFRSSCISIDSFLLAGGILVVVYCHVDDQRQAGEDEQSKAGKSETRYP